MIDFCASARELIASAERILLTSHVFPDADSVGSEAALARHLRRLGKSVAVCNPTPVQEVYRFLVERARLEPGCWSVWQDQLPTHDLIIVLDVNDLDYMGGLGEALQTTATPKLFFDHHQSVAHIGDSALIDAGAAATGEVLYRYFLATGAEIDVDMASTLYAAILFDTGGFRFRNTRDETLLIAAELIRRGASHAETAERLFENESFQRVELLTAALSRLESDPDGRVAWTYLTSDLFGRTGTTAVDADGIIDHLMTLRGIEVAVLFRELPKGEGVKVTFRSKGGQNVSRLAEDLGGGGRPTASGVMLTGSLKSVIGMILERVHANLDVDGEI